MLQKIQAKLGCLLLSPTGSHQIERRGGEGRQEKRRKNRRKGKGKEKD